MAAKKSYKWLGAAERVSPVDSQYDFQSELDEADVCWGASSSLEAAVSSEPKRVFIKKPIINCRKSSHIHQQRRPTASASLPVNVPEWSKIQSKEEEDVVAAAADEEGDKDYRIPPHVYLARTRGASFSVHEGIGRTLKGRDLSRVRNAIWKKTGFED